MRSNMSEFPFAEPILMMWWSEITEANETAEEHT